ncbi:Putative ribonuclease H protein At1g65750 [Linum perenne]
MNLGVCSITRAEIHGAFEGIRRAWDAGFQKVEVQIDLQAAINILVDKSSEIVRQHALEVMELQDLLRREWEVGIKHVYGETNHAVNYLANCGHGVPRGTHIVEIDNYNLAYYIRVNCTGYHPTIH